MIVICDLLCKGMSHEKVNSGFLYGLRLAFPEEKIVFYADATHIESIKSILRHDQITIEQIEYRPTYIRQHSTLFDIAGFYFGLKKIFTEIIGLSADKVFFLSFNTEALCAIKQLKRSSKFAHLKFTFVLHGAFETIADDGSAPRTIVLPRGAIPGTAMHGLLKRLRRIGLLNLPKTIFRKLVAKLPRLPLPNRVSKFFTVKAMMEWRHTADYKYISLSPHVTSNAAKYLDTQKLNFYTVILPTNFVKAASVPDNEYPKFAIFGYGDSLVLHNVAYGLSQKQISKPYEIRIIGMDNRGTEGFANVTCTSPGKALERSEMEKQAGDIDAFLILYDKSKYRLSCSGSILEALSMSKPIIHFDNECLNQFSTLENPIGFRCYTFDEYVNKLADIIENYDEYKKSFAEFRRNIQKQREVCSIERSVPELRESFVWQEGVAA